MELEQQRQSYDMVSGHHVTPETSQLADNVEYV
jgi:hypothetical protein